MVSPPAHTSLTGVLERIIFLNEENHYTIAELRPDSAKSAPPPAGATAPDSPLVTIVGPLPGVQCGETLTLTGEWTRHSQHGAQFKISTYQSRLPSSVYGIRKYLGSGLVPGIGKVYANKIVDAFGTDTFRVLSEESGKLRQVPGIGRVRATAIKAAWDEQKTLRQVHIFLQTYGVTTAQCVRIVKKFGAEAEPLLRAEPYKLAREIDGIGFKTADRIAINLGFANDAPPRLDAGLLYALQVLEEDGHTSFPRDELVTYAAQLLETSADRLEARLDALVGRRDLVEHGGGYLLPVTGYSVETRLPESASNNHQPVTNNPSGRRDPVGHSAGGTRPPDGFDPAGNQASAPGGHAQPSGTPQSALRNPQSVVQLPHNDRAERRIADTVRRLNSVPSGLPPIKVGGAVQWAQDKAGIEFHPLQSAAIAHALAHKFTILTGGPGTGKTTILRALVEILKAKKARVTLAAPTGRAAQRLAGTTGGFAQTIHRLLAFDPAHGGFEHNESKPLGTDFLIVDETSMLDTRLAAALLQAVPVRAHLLLVGDTDQLPSVGAGNVLKDLIKVSSELSAVSRPAPGSPPPATTTGKPQPGTSSVPSRPAAPTTNNPQPVTSVSSLPVTKLQHIYRQQKESLIITTAHAINSGENQPPPIVSEVAKAQAWSDLNFISATSAEDCLAKVIELVTRFIPQHFKWLDPIVDVQVLAPMHKGVVGVANLNTQLQAALNPGVERAVPARFAPAASLKTVSGEYRPGDKLIQLRNNYDKNLFNGDIGTVVSIDPAKGTLIADFDGDRHAFERGEFGDVALAYAISIHKSQGSEYPCVIIPLMKAHFMMLQRNLLYTAITRGKKKVFLVGEPAAYGMAVRNAESKFRHTHLKEKILGP